MVLHSFLSTTQSGDKSTTPHEPFEELKKSISPSSSSSSFFLFLIFFFFFSPFFLLTFIILLLQFIKSCIVLGTVSMYICIEKALQFSFKKRKK